MFTLAMVVIAASSWRTQTLGDVDSSFKVNVPFEFVVGDRNMPTGSYSIQMLLHSLPRAGNIEVVSFQSGEHAQQTVVASLSVQRNSRRESRMVFRRYGDTSFLSEIVLHGTRFVLPMSEREKKTSTRRAALELDFPIRETARGRAAPR